MRSEVQVLYRPPFGATQVAPANCTTKALSGTRRAGSIQESRRRDKRLKATASRPATTPPASDRSTGPGPPVSADKSARRRRKRSAPARRRVEPREMPLVLSDGRLCIRRGNESRKRLVGRRDEQGRSDRSASRARPR